MKDSQAIVLRNRKEADSLYIMALHDRELAQEIKPGQFVHMSIPTLQANILRRPFSVYAVDKDEGNIEILYQVVGVGTEHMTQWQPGYLTDVIGPIGSTWLPPAACKRALLVGGGVGAAPLFMLYEKLIEDGIDVDVILGAADSDSLVCRDRYEQVCGSSPNCSTDDGSFGREGFCTSLVEEAIDAADSKDEQYDFVAVCGPEPLMRIVSEMAINRGIACQVSMERRMACGVGACLSCVVDTVSGKKRACVDGPIFDAEEVIW